MNSEVPKDTEQPNHFAILGGRWQPPHRGHVWLVRHILDHPRIPRLVLGVVNPDPRRPPDPSFRKFLASDNPLTYWERSKIWTDILSALQLLSRVAIVPMWHPRSSLVQEESYLPPKRQRYWIVPLLDEDEREKAEDLEKLGEEVRIIEPAEIPDEVSRNHSFELRRMVLRGNPAWRDEVPLEVVKFFEENDIGERIQRRYADELHPMRFRRLER